MTAYSQDEGSDGSSGADEESYISTFFVRALYDYQSNDPSSLSFRQNDIIEVLTRLDSGWWDGLLGDERGWFPSNYVAVISAQEAEATLGALETSTSATSLPTESMIDMGDVMGVQLDEGSWTESGIDLGGATRAASQTPTTAQSSATDFWVPQVTPDGQVFYVNTHTGERSADLPHDTEDEMSDNDLGSFTTLQNGLGVTALVQTAGPASTPRETNGYAGFGVPRREKTPEPWARRLADDGLAYYYLNKKTGERTWTLPDSAYSPPHDGTHMISAASTSSVSLTSTASDTSGDRDTTSRFTADTSPARSRQRSLGDRDSVYSDGSDVHPTAQDRSVGPTPLQRSIAQARQNGTLELNAAEQAAQSLQDMMSPAHPQSVSELIATVQQAISGVIDRAKQPESKQTDSMSSQVSAVVNAVRNLLYIAALPSGQIPAEYTLDGSDSRTMASQSIQTQLKPAQRKVTATLSKLVLSTRAFRSDWDTSPLDATNRVEADALELDRALQAFVMDVHRYQRHSRIGSKRVLGAFSTDNIGLGLYGGGAAASWKGFGWVALNEEAQVPTTLLNVDAISTLKHTFGRLSGQLSSFGALLRTPNQVTDARGISFARDIIRSFTSFLMFIANLHVAKHVDIDGFQEEDGQSPAHEAYMRTVLEARISVRALEAITQAIYDDNAILLATAQELPADVDERFSSANAACCARLDGVLITLEANATSALQILEKLVIIGSSQAGMADGEYRQSINLRMSKILTIEDTLRVSSRISRGINEDEVVAIEDAFAFSGNKLPRRVTPFDDNYHAESSRSQTASEHTPSASWDQSTQATDSIYDGDTIGAETDKMSPVDADDDEYELDLKSRPKRSEKLKKFYGTDVPTHYLQQLNPEATPWYLRPDYNDADINLDPADGSVKAGTVAALIERLTAHDNPDTKMEKTFMMTWKSFTTIDTLIEGLAQRFRILPPDSLKPNELEEWKKKKQALIHARVFSRIKTLVQDEDDVLDKEDLRSYDQLKTFLMSEDVKSPGASQCMVWIERSEKGENIKRIPVNKDQAPQPIIPRNINKKLKLLDIDPLEIARQLTIMEYQLFMKIRPMECILRSREQRAGKVDHITALIQSSNAISIWVADCILSKEDSRRRAAVIKHFINVADRCLALRNFNSMVALLAGLGQPAIRRLKRTWEQVNQRNMQALEVIEWTMDSSKNFNNYRTTLAAVSPPCVPFFGVYLTQLTFIQDGNPDNVNGLVNFSKRHKAAEVINDMKRWQTKPYNLQPISGVLAFIEDALNGFTNGSESYQDHFWSLSLDREPREREDEKMARLLQESGFL